MTRTIYGADEVYARMDWDSLADWRWRASFGALQSHSDFGPKKPVLSDASTSSSSAFVS